MYNELDISGAFREINEVLPIALDWCREAEFTGAPTVEKRWYSPASTFTYHTISAIEGASENTLVDMAEVFFRANSLVSQPWYPAFLGGWSEAVDGPLPHAISQARRGQASFDFGLRRRRFYNQLVAAVSPAENIRGVALRSISGIDGRENEVKAYTLSPTMDLFHLKGHLLEWHHIVTVAGPALLPPVADRVLMNTLRRLRLNWAERNTYLEEARLLRTIEPEQWSQLRQQLN